LPGGGKVIPQLRQRIEHDAVEPLRGSADDDRESERLPVLAGQLLHEQIDVLQGGSAYVPDGLTVDLRSNRRVVVRVRRLAYEDSRGLPSVGGMRPLDSRLVVRLADYLEAPPAGKELLALADGSLRRIRLISERLHLILPQQVPIAI
jgi:hypothetical protein